MFKKSIKSIVGFLYRLREISPSRAALYQFFTITFVVICMRLIGKNELVPLFNVSPMESIAIFSCVIFGPEPKSRNLTGGGYILKFFILLLCSDIAINYCYLKQLNPFYSGFYWQYFGYLVLIGLGRSIAKQLRFTPFLFANVLGAVLFFTVSNFGVWFTSGLYPLTNLGLINCFMLALPFLKISIFSNVLFGCIAYVVFVNQESISISLKNEG